MKSRIGVIVLLAAILLLAMVVPAQAEQRVDNFRADFTLGYNDDPFTAIGTYSVDYDGEPYGAGDAFVTYIPRFPGVQQGTMVLDDVDGESRMVIRFSMTYIGDLAGCDGLGGLAQYKILYERNLGDYELMGNGTMTLCNVEGVGTGSLVGWATESP